MAEKQAQASPGYSNPSETTIQKTIQEENSNFQNLAGPKDRTKIKKENEQNNGNSSQINKEAGPSSLKSVKTELRVPCHHENRSQNLTSHYLEHDQKPVLNQHGSCELSQKNFFEEKKCRNFTEKKSLAIFVQLYQKDTGKMTVFEEIMKRFLCLTQNYQAYENFTPNNLFTLTRKFNNKAIEDKEKLAVRLLENCQDMPRLLGNCKMELERVYTNFAKDFQEYLEKIADGEINSLIFWKRLYFQEKINYSSMHPSWDHWIL